MKYHRWQSKGIERALNRRRIVYLSGPRQVGKSTLVRGFNGRNVEYLDLDDESILEKVKFDPISTVEHNKQTLIIDEVQKVPELILAIKRVVDRDQRYGRFLLTGSANMHQIPTIRESLAGRITKVRLRPLSQGEIEGAEPKFLYDALDQKFSTNEATFSRDQYIDIALRGGYPEPFRQNERERSSWASDYTDSVLDRDLRDITQIRRRRVMRNLTTVIASLASHVFTKDTIRKQLASNHSISRDTLDSYLNILESMYLIDYLEQWTSTDYRRTRKKPRIFMPDSGLTSSLLNWRKRTIRDNHLALGKLFEMFVYSELNSLIDVTDHEFEIFHYRDGDDREIDFIIEHEDGGIIGIEVKASTRAVIQDFKHLRWFKNKFAKNRPFVGILLYAGDVTGRLDNDMWIVPIEKMWNN